MSEYRFPEAEFGGGCDIAVIADDRSHADIYEVERCNLSWSDASGAEAQLDRSQTDLRTSGLVEPNCRFRRFLLHEKIPHCGVRFSVAAFRDRGAFQLVSSHDEPYRSLLVRYKSFRRAGPF